MQPVSSPRRRSTKIPQMRIIALLKLIAVWTCSFTFNQATSAWSNSSRFCPAMIKKFKGPRNEFNCNWYFLKPWWTTVEPVPSEMELNWIIAPRDEEYSDELRTINCEWSSMLGNSRNHQTIPTELRRVNGIALDGKLKITLPAFILNNRLSMQSIH